MPVILLATEFDSVVVDRESEPCEKRLRSHLPSGDAKKWKRFPKFILVLNAVAGRLAAKQGRHRRSHQNFLPVAAAAKFRRFEANAQVRADPRFAE
jgi:hypothetical protein